MFNILDLENDELAVLISCLYKYAITADNQSEINSAINLFNEVMNHIKEGK